MGGPAAGAGAIAVAAHPGVSSTELARYIPGMGSSIVRHAGNGVFGLISQRPELGALPTVRAALDPDARGGYYYGPDGFREMKGPAVVVWPDAHAAVQADQERLWALSEELTGVTFPI